MLLRSLSLIRNTTSTLRVLSEIVYLRLAVQALIHLVDFLMPRVRKITRQAIDTDLSEAQNARRKARERWIDMQIDMVIQFWPETKENMELMRIDFHTENDAYCDKLDDADRALINRVTTVILNQQLDLEDRIDERLGRQPD